MSNVTLESYLRRKASGRRSPSLPLVSTQNHGSGSRDITIRPSSPRRALPATRIRNLHHLWLRFLTKPQYFLRPSLEGLISELLELEKIYNVALLNPMVIDTGRRARECMKSAEYSWDIRLVYEAEYASKQAVLFQIESLISAYRTTSADRIVSARIFLDSHRWIDDPARLLELHEMARARYGEARVYQEENEVDQARRLYMESIVNIDMLNLEVERMGFTDL